MKVNQTYVNRAQTFISLTKDKNSLYFRLKHIQRKGTKFTVVLAFLARDHPISVTVPSLDRPRPYGTLLPQRGSPF